MDSVEKIKILPSPGIKPRSSHPIAIPTVVWNETVSGRDRLDLLCREVERETQGHTQCCHLVSGHGLLMLRMLHLSQVYKVNQGSSHVTHITVS
jgi:hypothetical protein